MSQKCWVYEVWTFPAGQALARRLITRSTRRAAQHFARRERYLQIIRREVRP